MSNEFKIVKIIDEYTVIINAGTNDGIESGDKFQILDKTGSAVRDPDTNEILGHLDLIKDTVTASEVQEKMCFCSSHYEISFGTSFMETINTINQATIVPKQKKLNIDLDQVTGGLRKSNEPIRLGDAVRLIKASKKKENEM